MQIFFTESMEMMDNGAFEVIGVGALQQPFDCFVANKINWVRWVQKDNKTICCRAKYNDLQTMTCNESMGIDEAIYETIISISPTPAGDFINTKYDDTINKNNLSINLFDINGNIIAKFYEIGNRLDISKIPDGNYYICFEIENKKIFRPIIISK